jgi:hypothetical protein
MGLSGPSGAEGYVRGEGATPASLHASAIGKLHISALRPAVISASGNSSEIHSRGVGAPISKGGENWGALG